MKPLAAFRCRHKKARKIKQKMLRFTALFLIWLAVTGAILLTGNTARSANSKTGTVIVESGDTLWALAKIHAPRGMDIRHYLDEVLQKNRLSNVFIYPGQELILP